MTAASPLRSSTSFPQLDSPSPNPSHPSQLDPREPPPPSALSSDTDRQHQQQHQHAIGLGISTPPGSSFGSVIRSRKTSVVEGLPLSTDSPVSSRAASPSRRKVSSPPISSNLSESLTQSQSQAQSSPQPHPNRVRDDFIGIITPGSFTPQSQSQSISARASFAAQNPVTGSLDAELLRSQMQGLQSARQGALEDSNTPLDEGENDYGVKEPTPMTRSTSPVLDILQASPSGQGAASPAGLGVINSSGEGIRTLAEVGEDLMAAPNDSPAGSPVQIGTGMLDFSGSQRSRVISGGLGHNSHVNSAAHSPSPLGGRGGSNRSPSPMRWKELAKEDLGRGSTDQSLLSTNDLLGPNRSTSQNSDQNISLNDDDEQEPQQTTRLTRPAMDSRKSSLPGGFPQRGAAEYQKKQLERWIGPKPTAVLEEQASGGPSVPREPSEIEMKLKGAMETASQQLNSVVSGPSAHNNVLAKLLLFAFLVAFVPITVYFTSVAYFFNGSTTIAAIAAIVSANLVMVSYVVVAFKEDIGDQKTLDGSLAKKTQ